MRMYAEKVAPIRMILMDVDGVLTDGGIIYEGADAELKRFDIQDGMGISMAIKAGFRYLKGRRVLQSTFYIDLVAMIFGLPRALFVILAATQFHRGAEVVGFLFGFPDVSAALQHTGGRLFPFGIVDLLREFKRTKWIALNGAGILSEFQGRGGNALLYSEMEKTIREHGFEHADLTQVAESAVQMRRDLINVGGRPYKNHRVYRRSL